jgi:hypothetical protein
VFSSKEEILGESYVVEPGLESITSESKSRLRGIENSNFSDYLLKSICIPQNVEVRGILCFAGSDDIWDQLESILFSSESKLTRIEERCFSKYPLKSIHIPRNGEILSESCFSGPEQESITFKSESRLTRIEERCYSRYLLISICIPRNVEILGKSCFAYSGLQSMTFQKESRLTRIED